MLNSGSLKLGSILRELRNERKLNQEYLARVLNIKRQTYSAWERDVSCPDVGTVNRLAEFYGVSTDFILGRTATREPYEIDKEEPPQEISSLDGIEDLSEESRKDLENYIKLLKIKDQVDKSKEDPSSVSGKEA